MRIVIETPKWSFVKYRLMDGKPVREFLSPLPNLFNYGHIEGTLAPDGMEEDAIVLGPRLKAGQRADAQMVGTVKFLDDGVEDDKKVTSIVGKISLWDRVRMGIFFNTYAVFKTVQCLIKEGRIGSFKYSGFKACP